jgi:hypothetical protein
MARKQIGEGPILKSQPLGEVFGFPVDNHSDEAVRHQKDKLCPFGNRVPNCTKSSADDPVGVCSVHYADKLVVTCPIRFRERNVIISDAKKFFFAPDTPSTSLREVRLNDARGRSAGNIDYVLVAYDENGTIVDYGALEVQAVYITGNIRKPFKMFVAKPAEYLTHDWTRQLNYPKPDFLSSSRKRLAPQLLFKGKILNRWQKKMAVAIDVTFFKTLPQMQPVTPDEADLAWLIYDLEHVKTTDQYSLVLRETVFTKWETASAGITTPEIREKDDLFRAALQKKLDKLNQGLEDLNENEPENADGDEGE